jgi:hypothetical protein
MCYLIDYYPNVMLPWEDDALPKGSESRRILSMRMRMRILMEHTEMKHSEANRHIPFSSRRSGTNQEFPEHPARVIMDRQGADVKRRSHHQYFDKR